MDNPKPPNEEVPQPSDETLADQTSALADGEVPSLAAAGLTGPESEAASAGIPTEDTVEEPEPLPAPAQSRLGRFARAALRWTLTALVVFVLGIAALYFMRMRPLQAELSAVQTQATQTTDRLHQVQQDLMAVQEREKMLTGQLEQVAKERDLAVGRYDLQKVYTNLAVARLALTNKDGAQAKTALEAARADLNALLPTIQAKDAALAESLQGRLDLVLNELNRDPRVALSDLDIFATTLAEVEKDLFE